MNVNAKLVEKTSAKSGKPYYCLEVQLSTEYKKIVLLDKAEIELIKLSYGNNSGK